MYRVFLEKTTKSEIETGKKLTPVIKTEIGKINFGIQSRNPKSKKFDTAVNNKFFRFQDLYPRYNMQALYTRSIIVTTLQHYTFVYTVVRGNLLYAHCVRASSTP